MRVVILSLCAVFLASAQPPPGYRLLFQSNFMGKGGNADGWLPISNWGPLPQYYLGSEVWNPEFISHTPYDGDFGYARFDPSVAWQGWGQMFVSPYVKNGVWYGGMVASVDTTNDATANPPNGFYKAAPAYWEASLQLPRGRDAWPAFWLDDLQACNRYNKYENEVEIDIGEWYGNNIDRQEISIHLKDKYGNGLPAPHTAVQLSALADRPHVYGCWILPDLTHFYVDGVEIWNTPTLPEMLHPLFVMVDYALQDRSFTGVSYSPPQTMSVQWIRCYAP